MTIGRSRKSRRLCDLGRRNDRFDVLRLVEYFGRETMRQVKLANDDFDIDAEIVFVAENLNHSSARILGGRRPVSDFDIDDYAFEVVPFGAAGGLLAQNAIDGFLRPGPRDGPRDSLRDGATVFLRVLLAWRDHDLLRDLLVNRCHVVPLTAVMKDSDHRAVCAHDRANDASFGAAVGTDCADLYQHAVTVHRRAHRKRRNENVSRKLCLEPRIERGSVGSDKTVAVAMHAQPSD